MRQSGRTLENGEVALQESKRTEQNIYENSTETPSHMYLDAKVVPIHTESRNVMEPTD